MWKLASLLVPASLPLLLPTPVMLLVPVLLPSLDAWPLAAVALLLAPASLVLLAVAPIVLLVPASLPLPVPTAVTRTPVGAVWLHDRSCRRLDLPSVQTVGWLR